MRLSGKKSAPGSENSRHKSSEGEGYLTCLRKSKEVRVAGKE